MEIIEYNGYRIEIEQDADFEPWDCIESKIYAPNFKLLETGDFPEILEDYHFWPLYMYKHSAIALSINPFSCPYDSGRIGVICLPKSEYKDRKEAETHVMSELEMLTNYLNGEVYQFCIYDGDEIIDSCAGLDDYDYALEYAQLCCRDHEATKV